MVRFDGIPNIVRGERGGRLVLGQRVRLFRGVGIYLETAESQVSIGDRTFINRRSEIVCRSRVTIGTDCAISWDVCISDTDNHSIDGSAATSDVTIGNNVWIGSGVAILKGVEIGEGAVIGARSVVTKSVPARSLVVGSPAKIIRSDVRWEL
ncbi:acyltransferase [Arthrobacter glacialis]|uniref:Acyltransferase n=1 Tax=Arthrobacter glacialis TaxID=1664 RepID=A0A2S4A044_ARTGL|nr:acyltransferase [Arthrobacter glacialis]POH74906.1 acyltransferase [Arthrobacter glacialis]